MAEAGANPAATDAPDSSERRPSVATLLLSDGVLNPDQLKHALRVQGKMGGEQGIVAVLQQLGLVEEAQILDVLKRHRLEIPLGSLLLELGYVTRDQLRTALKIQESSRGEHRLGDILVRKRVLKERDLVRVLASQLGLDSCEADVSRVDESLLSRLSGSACEQFGFFPIRRAGDKVVVAFADPLDDEARAMAEKVFESALVPVVSTQSAIRIAAQSLSRKQDAQKAGRGSATAHDSSPTASVDRIIQAAIRENASDIHVEPLSDRVRVRLRCDGVLREYMELPRDSMATVTSRMKILAGADISEKRRHQDGRILYEDPRTGATLDIRASFYVTIHGEAVVLRLLNQNMTVLDLPQLGMSPAMMTRFKENALETPSGVVIVTGPTGSGKTTTLYSCVHYLNDEYTSIITAEDPVEYVVDGISQCSLNPKLDLTYEQTLKHIVRQDPDVIVLGEIRDQFSAECAIQSALTGHKVLTTFHTEDSIGGLLRLLNMNIEAFLISSTVVCVVAQRLIRRVCRECAEPAEPEARVLQLLGWGRHDCADATFLKGSGCEHCHFTGYRGRVAVFENLLLTEAVRDAIIARQTSAQIRQISVESSGLVTLLEDGLVKASRGETTLEEVRRHLPRLNKPRPLSELRRLSGIHA